MNVYREILPDSYLLILSGSATSDDLPSLQQALNRAASSGKTSVWLDCSALASFPTAALRLLSDYYLRFQSRRLSLVLCHLTDNVAAMLQMLPWAQRPPVVATLLEAAMYCRSQPRQAI
ncbi:STAS domain-containing protein [Hymenobacter puniceus]|uniref:STAS domain-containing protein n=1 Tax=Hymenobacter sp. BT190 TaxID=2763505 RepID=UPI0021C60F91|nr:STAS domain-containing protein [Hymenobacter sp. BT190]